MQDHLDESKKPSQPEGHIQTKPLSTLLTVHQFSKKHPAFTEASLRWLIFNAEPRKGAKGIIAGNGVDVAIFRVGRKVLIDEARFFMWIESSNSKAI